MQNHLSFLMETQLPPGSLQLPSLPSFCLLLSAQTRVDQLGSRGERNNDSNGFSTHIWKLPCVICDLAPSMLPMPSVSSWGSGHSQPPCSPCLFSYFLPVLPIKSFLSLKTHCSCHPCLNSFPHVRGMGQMLFFPITHWMWLLSWYFIEEEVKSEWEKSERPEAGKRHIWNPKPGVGTRGPAFFFYFTTHSLHHYSAGWEKSIHEGCRKAILPPGNCCQWEACCH